jgi:hypothetical protein
MTAAQASAESQSGVLAIAERVIGVNKGVRKTPPPKPDMQRRRRSSPRPVSTAG